jgi:hypothetical protein
VVVHSALPDSLTRALGESLRPAGVEHIAHGDSSPLEAAEAAAVDGRSLVLVGPFRSADVAEAVEVTAPVGLPLIAPVATWAGVTRDDEPGCEDPAQHHGTILRLLARDTEVAARLANDLQIARQRAYVVAGVHSYGRQLDGQLRQVGLPRVDDPADASVVVLCARAGHPEIEWAAALAPLPVIAFDGVQGAHLGDASDVRLALPIAPVDTLTQADLMAGVGQAQRAAELIVAALSAGAHDRTSLLAEMRTLGRFDEHGDPIDPPVWLWHADADWTLTADRPLPSSG